MANQSSQRSHNKFLADLAVSSRRVQLLGASMKVESKAAAAS